MTSKSTSTDKVSTTSFSITEPLSRVMPATRRTNGASASADATSSSLHNTSSTTTSTPPPTHSPFLPTRTEAIFLAIYPVTLLLGSAFSHLSPTLYPPFNKSTYDIDHQSFQPASAAPSYFAQKRNVFNVYFVKFGWFWCSLALLVFTVLASRGRPARSGRGEAERTEEKDATTLRIEGDARLRRNWQTLLRWTLATFFWILVTQWCFGPPLIDRGFSLTGGACDLAAAEIKHDHRVDITPDTKTLLTHAACKVAGGAWRGGYDISGHVFILVLGSAMLWLEMLPYLIRESTMGFGAARVVKESDGQITRIGALGNTDNQAAVGVPSGSSIDNVKKGLQSVKNATDQAGMTTTTRYYATTLALFVAGFSWWMLLMTAAFFHTWPEKLTGGVLALSALWAIYLLPRGLPVVREVLGMPGV